MKHKIETKMNEFIESLLSKPQLTCEEYLVLKAFHKELLAEEQALRHAEARARKIDNMFNCKGER